MTNSYIVNNYQDIGKGGAGMRGRGGSWYNRRYHIPLGDRDDN
jgi:hypothetical protein